MTSPLSSEPIKEEGGTAHTPGPWHLNSESDTVHGFSKEGEALIVVYDLGTNEADHSLIAAAPDLLAALRMAVRQNSHDMLMTGEELRKCGAAIAKAGSTQ